MMFRDLLKMKPRPLSYTIAFLVTLATAYGIVNRGASDGEVKVSEVPVDTSAGTRAAQRGAALSEQTLMVASAPRPQARAAAAVHAGEDDHDDAMSGAAHTDDDLLGIIFSADYEPAYDAQGTFRGMRISSLPEDGFAAAPPGKRLQDGDVITRINDVVLSDENSLAAAIRQFYWLEGRAVVVFVVEREGTTYSVPLEMRH